MIINCTLSTPQIESSVSEAEQFVLKAGIRKDSSLKFKLSLEEILLIYRDCFGQETPFSLKFKKKGGDVCVLLTVKAEKYDPLSNASEILERTLRNFDGAPVWSWVNGENHLEYRLPLYNTLAKNIQMSWKYMRGQRKTFVLAVVSQLISVGLNVAAPVLSAQVIVNLETGVFQQILLIALALLAVRAVNSVLMFISNRSYNIVYNKTLSNLEKDLVHGALQITNYCIDEKGTGLFIQRLTSDTSALATGFNTLADLISQICN